MVFGAKFPWGKAREAFKNARKPAPFKFSPFGDEDVAISPTIEQMLESLGLDDIPLPPQISEPESDGIAEPTLLQPRPKRSRTLRDALDRFEEVAQFSDETDYGDFTSERAASPCSSETDDVDIYAIRLVTPRSCHYSPIPFWDGPSFIVPNHGDFPSFGFHDEDRSLGTASMDISTEAAEDDDFSFQPLAASSPLQPDQRRPLFSGARDLLSPGFTSFLDLSPLQSPAFSGNNDGGSRSASPSPLPSPGSPAQCTLDWLVSASEIDAKFRLFDNEAWSDSMCAEVEAYINADDFPTSSLYNSLSTFVPFTT